MDGSTGAPPANAAGLRVVADLVEIAGKLPPLTVVVVGGDRLEDLCLVESARDHGIVRRVVLVGCRRRIMEGVERLGIDVASEDVLAAEDEDSAARATVELVKNKRVDMVLKGNISTPVLNRHMLAIAARRTVSLVSVFDAAPIAGGRPIVLTDAGVTTVCTLERMADLVQNAADVARTVLGISRPRVAILSANEKQIPSLPSTKMGADLAALGWRDAVVYGPLSFDLAIDPGSVEIKGLPSHGPVGEVAGQADVLVCPSIDAANILYKVIAAMVKYGQASLASITIGFPLPYIILSRSDALSTRLDSIALCSVYLHRKRASNGSLLDPESQEISP